MNESDLLSDVHYLGTLLKENFKGICQKLIRCQKYVVELRFSRYCSRPLQIDREHLH